MNYELLGQQIKLQRAKKMLTQEQLAEIADITQKYLSLIERGKAKAKLEIYVSLANALGVSIDYLLEDSIDNCDDFYINSVMKRMKTLSKIEREFLHKTVEFFSEFRSSNLKKEIRKV